MRAHEGDLIFIEYTTEFTHEHVVEGEAIVLFEGFNGQPLIVLCSDLKEGNYNPKWSAYEYITEVRGHFKDSLPELLLNFIYERR